jgi:hypothetical protein
MVAAGVPRSYIDAVGRALLPAESTVGRALLTAESTVGQAFLPVKTVFASTGRNAHPTGNNLET